MQYDIQIEYRSSANLRADGDAFCQKITGTIIAIDLSSGDEDGQVIGEIELAYMDITSAEDDEYGLFSLFDADPLPSTYCFTLYELDQYDWSKRVYQSLGEDIINYNLLIIHRVQLLPAFRGHQIGLLAIRRSIQQFGHGCGLACLKAYPYQIELSDQRASEPREYDAYGLGQFPADAAKATQDLEVYYQKAGFIKIQDSDLMAINLAKELPSMEQLGATCGGLFEIDGDV